MYNPIIGMYELRHFLGLRDLPSHEDGVARVLRRFGSNQSVQYIYADMHQFRKWEKLWCVYADCVFVDLTGHMISHVFYFQNQTYGDVKIEMTYNLYVSDPIRIVREEITDARAYLHNLINQVIEKMLDSVCCMKDMDAQLQSRIETVVSGNDLFFIENIVLSSHVMKNPHGSTCAKVQNRDVSKLLEIALSSDLEAHEVDEVKRIILNEPRNP